MGSNFDFVQRTVPSAHDDCARAESYLISDPTTACIYSRRAVERLVAHVYAVRGLSEPYQLDLAARINDAAFGAEVGHGITRKLNLIRRVGNQAVHEHRRIAPQNALTVLRELFDVAIFVSYRYSSHPGAVPTQARFDSSLAKSRTPLSRAEVRLMLLLRANVLASGHSGSRPIVAETLAEMLNKGVHPVIPEQGSVGASGDLAPLAHLALVLIGEGHAEFQGQTMSGADAMRRAGISPITLGPKEGLAVLNGTQALSSVGAIALAAAIDVQ
ncbi:MAG TPA: aromatic amino acid lyase, partial [Marmoricola sp.]|nr:aromatic amino acid lyase [Marmoricola sp.]